METRDEYAQASFDNVQNLQKHIADDCVKYQIYAIDSLIKDESQLVRRLEQVKQIAEALVDEYLDGYIWQREHFALTLESGEASLLEASKTISPVSEPVVEDESSRLYRSQHLQGSTVYADSIADEWTIVFLLRELSRRCRDVWIRVWDGDGDFLLIEAANALPKWLEPSIAEHRVWLHGGRLAILAEEKVPTKAMTLETAILGITNGTLDVICDDKIEKEAFFRLRDYPEAIQSTFHHALVTIPRRVAYVLHERPGCISAAVESFYLRNAVALKTLSTKDTGTLFLPPEDFVTTSVKFTRVGYAQLVSQDFALPGSWSGVTPHITEPRVLVGMKLSCGFEMLLQDKLHADESNVNEIKAMLEEVEGGKLKLPADAELQAWDQRQDSEKWLDIDYEDLDKELKGRSAPQADNKAKFADKAAQENLAHIVSRFESFVDDDKAGLDGVDDDDTSNDEHDDDDDTDDDDDELSSDTDSDGEDKAGSFDDAEFERAMRDMMGMPREQQETNELMDEARRLALEMEADEEIIGDEDEIRRLMEEMGAELDGLGALNVDDKNEGSSKLGKKKGKSRRKGKDKANGRQGNDSPDVSQWNVDDDQDGHEKTVMVKNLLESLKSQGGMSGPAGNMLASMGLRMPRHDDSDED